MDKEVARMEIAFKAAEDSKQKTEVQWCFHCKKVGKVRKMVQFGAMQTYLWNNKRKCKSHHG